MAKVVDWSRVGRGSRRKGKKNECEIAAKLRKWTGLNWQSTRNSGRTDLRGDVYCVDRHDPNVVIECKHRADFSITDMIKGTLGYVNEMQKVIEVWKDETRAKRLVVFSKINLLGTFVMIMEREIDDLGCEHFRCWPAAAHMNLKLGDEPKIHAADDLWWTLLPDEGLSGEAVESLLFVGN